MADWKASSDKHTYKLKEPVRGFEIFVEKYMGKWSHRLKHTITGQWWTSEKKYAQASSAKTHCLSVMHRQIQKILDELKQAEIGEKGNDKT